MNNFIITKNANNQFKKTNFQYLKTNNNNWKGWYCEVGMHNLWIGSNGDVYGSVCREGGKIGNIYDEIHFPKKSIICGKEKCYCATDISIPKSKTNTISDSLEQVNNIDLNSVDQLENDEIVFISDFNKFGRFEEFQINWNIGKRCNYDCSYCPASVHNNFDKHLSFDDFRRAFDKLYEYIKDRKKVKITFTGGEPTINPKFLDFLEYAKKDNIYFYTNTNGTKNIEYLKKLNQISGMHISVHLEFVEKIKFINKMKQLLSHKILQNNHNYMVKVVIKFMLMPQQYESNKEFIDSLLSLREPNIMDVNIEPLVDKSNDYKLLKYTEEEKKILGKV